MPGYFQITFTYTDYAGGDSTGLTQDQADALAAVFSTDIPLPPGGDHGSGGDTQTVGTATAVLTVDLNVNYLTEVATVDLSVILTGMGGAENASYSGSISAISIPGTGTFTVNRLSGIDAFPSTLTISYVAVGRKPSPVELPTLSPFQFNNRPKTMIELSDQAVNGTVYIPWNTYDINGDAATVTGVTLKFYKDDSTTERSSASGITSSIDHDATTGSHLVKVDLSDNTDAGFWAAGHNYMVRMTGTVDSNVASGWIAMFGIQARYMRGTDSANTTTPPTVTAIRTEIDSNSTQLAGILTKLKKYFQLALRKDAAIGTDNATEVTEINANGGSGAGAFANTTDALESIRDNQGTPQTGDTYARVGAPAGASVSADVAALKVISDKLDDTLEDDVGTYRFTTNALEQAPTGGGGDATEAKQDTILSRLGTPAGASMSVDIAAIKSETATIVVDTNELQTDWVNGGRLDLILDARASQTSVDTIDGIVDAIVVDTGTDIPASIAALNDLDATAVQTAAAAALTAYDPPTNTEMEARTLVAASYATASALATVDTNVDSILAVTDHLGDTLEDDAGTYRFTTNALEQAPTGGGSTNITSILGTALTETTAGNLAGNLSTFLDNSDALTTKVVDNIGTGGGDATAANQTVIASTLASIAGATFNTSTDSLEAIRDRGDAAWITGSTVSAADIADAVLDEPMAGHVTAGTLGKAIADTLDDTSELQADNVDGGRTDLLIDGIKAKTDNLPASPAAVGSAMTLADDAITAAKYDETTAFPLALVDTGSTKILRTGADADTGETLSDQIDAVLAAAGTNEYGIEITPCFTSTAGTTLRVMVALRDRFGRQIDATDLAATLTGNLKIREHGASPGAENVDQNFTETALKNGVVELEISTPALTGDRLYEYEVTITINGNTYTDRKDFNTIG